MFTLRTKRLIYPLAFETDVETSGIWTAKHYYEYILVLFIYCLPQLFYSSVPWGFSVQIKGEDAASVSLMQQLMSATALDSDTDEWHVMPVKDERRQSQKQNLLNMNPMIRQKHLWALTFQAITQLREKVWMNSWNCSTSASLASDGECQRGMASDQSFPWCFFSESKLNH